MSKKAFLLPVVLSAGTDTGDIGGGEPGEIIGTYSDQGPQDMTFEQWMSDIVGSYESIEDALADLDVDSNGVLDENDFQAWLANNW